MANRYPQPIPTAQPGTAVLGANIPNMFPGTTAWSQQPARSQIEQNEKHKEYLKQQQKLRLMAASSSSSQTVSADALIENLLGKKETFKPKSTQTSSGTAAIPAPVPVIGGVGFGSMAPLHMSYAPPPSVSTGPPLVGGFASSTAPPGVAEPLNQPYKTSFLSTINPNVSGINPQTKVAVAPQFGASVPPSVSLPTWLCSSSQTLPQFYKQVWKLVGQDKGLVDTKRIFPILLTSGLPTDILGFIWGMANRNATGQLTEQELYIVLALVALAQNGCTFNNLGILNLIPQAPIPSLSLANIEPTMPYVGGETSTVPTQAKMRREELNLNPPLSVRDSTSAPSFLEDDGFDDFTDFQSAVPSSGEITSQPLPASTGSMTNRDTASPPVEPHSVLPEVMVETPFVQKFPSVVVVTNSTGRSIGSRLANHSLGTPKPSKMRHHKHHHHHHHHHRSQTQMTSQVSSSSADDDFTDFQQARDIMPSLNEAFPKCVMKQPVAKTYLLKESAIRSEVEPTIKEPLAAKSTNVQFSNENEKPKASIDTSKSENIELEKNTDVMLTTSKPVPSRETKTDGTKDLMLIEEDKYSALRNLSLAVLDTASATTDHSPASDEFGDFLSAEPVQSVDDSFADIATRSNKSLGAVGDVWKPSTVNEPQPAKFAVDDWGDFEEAPHMLEDTSAVSSSAADISLSLMGLDLNASCLKSDKSSGEITDPASGKSFTDSKASSADIQFDDSWDLKIQENQESSGPFPSVPGNDPEGFIGFLGKIYSTDEKLEHHNTKPDIFDSENDYLHRNTLESDQAQCNNDDFGEFVGPETWAEQKYGATGKDIAIENQLAIGLYADTQSVSSLELPPLALSRHGSVPSLDLKIFPSSTERSGGSGGNQPWDLSPQGIDHQLSEWQRCLRSCLTLLQATVNIFGNVSKEEVLEEVVGCSEGKSYLQNLLEVYGVCRRVEWSYKQMGSGAENKEIDSLLADIYSAWTFLESLYVKADIPIGPSFGVPADASNREAATSCGVCLTDVTAGKTEKSIMNTSQLEYGGHVYHSACANLWVNCVDSSLPALATGGSAFL